MRICVFMLEDGALSYDGKQQEVPVCDADNISAAAAAREAMWLHKLMLTLVSD